MLRAKALPAIRARLAGRQPGASTSRSGQKALHRLLDVLVEDGVHLLAMQGPWEVRKAAARAGRARRRGLVYVERGHTRIPVASEVRARQLAGFLNWCEVEERELSSP